MNDRVEIVMGPVERDGKRAVMAMLGKHQQIDRFDPVSEFHRRRFREHVIARFRLGDDAHEFVEQLILDALTAAEADSGATLATPKLVTLSDVRPKAVHWFWDGYIPAGAITLLYGDPGEGKSQISVNIAARHSKGTTMPPHDLPTGAPGGDVLLLSAEDDMERTTLPRLIAAEGDPRRVHFLREVQSHGGATPRLVQLPTDVPLLESIVTERKVGLVVVDVFSAFIAEGLNQNSDSDMRSCLSVMSSMAERTQAAVLLLAHLNKKEGTRSMYRGGGSIAIVGAARSAFAVGSHPDDPTVKVLCSVKSNLGKAPASLTYSIEPAGSVSRIVWGGQTDLSASDVLKGEAKGNGGANKLETAKQIMQDLLADGPRGSNEVLGACEAAGIGERTYHSARKALGVKSERTGFGGDGQWLLTMPANGYHHETF